MAESPFLVEHFDPGVVRVTVPMRGRYFPFGKVMWGFDLWTGLAALTWLLVSTFARWVLGVKPPPRAVFEIDDEHCKTQFCEPRSGERTSYVWPRASIMELRKNRYEKGLWVHVIGSGMNTHLRDLPDEEIEKLSEILNTVLHDRKVTVESQGHAVA